MSIRVFDTLPSVKNPRILNPPGPAVTVSRTAALAVTGSTRTVVHMAGVLMPSWCAARRGELRGTASGERRLTPSGVGGT